MSIWEEIKDRLSVEEVISEYLPIKSAGINYKCNCPFHKEKTASLIISPQKKIWHCFGCGAGGDVFKFVEMYENLSKKELLFKLARRAGLEDKLTEDQKAWNKSKQDQTFTQEKQLEPKSDFKQGLEYLNWAKNIFHKLLIKALQDRNHYATKYCLDRGLSLADIKKFELGFALKSNFLLSLATKYNLKLHLLEATGLLINQATTNQQANQEANQEEKQKIKQETVNAKFYKDKFKDRLIFPIFDSQGRVVGFSGRVFSDDNPHRPKYLNSPQTAWFNKSNLLFGLHLAKKEILKSKQVFLVEGNMDVITAHKKGLGNTLASLGTSFTANQAKQINRLSQKIIIAFDNDQAGQTSSQKIYTLSKLGKKQVCKVVIPKEFKDFDEWLNQDSFELQNMNIVPFLDWFLELYLPKLSSPNFETKKEFLEQFLSLVGYQDALEQEHYLLKLKSLTNYSLNTLKSQVQILANSLSGNLSGNLTTNSATNSLSNLTSSLTNNPTNNRTDKSNQERQNLEQLKSQDFQNHNRQKLLAVPFLISLQKFFSLYTFILHRHGSQQSFSKGVQSIFDKADKIFILARYFVEDLSIYTNLEAYLQQQQQILDLIFEKQFANYEIFELEFKIDILYRQILIFIDTNHAKNLFDDTFKSQYQKLKAS